METPLKRLRESRGLTQKQLADALGLDQGNLSRLERGHLKSVAAAEKIADYFGREFITEAHILYPERYTQVPA